jgi:hypothetical protein
MSHPGEKNSTIYKQKKKLLSEHILRLRYELLCRYVERTLYLQLTTLLRACNLTVFIHSLTGLVGQPFASRHEGPRFNPQGGTSMKPGFSC